MLAGEKIKKVKSRKFRVESLLLPFYFLLFTLIGALGEGIVVFDGREVVGESFEVGVDFLSVKVIQEIGNFRVVGC